MQATRRGDVRVCMHTFSQLDLRLYEGAGGWMVADTQNTTGVFGWPQHQQAHSILSLPIACLLPRRRYRC